MYTRLNASNLTSELSVVSKDVQIDQLVEAEARQTAQTYLHDTTFEVETE